MEYNFKKGKKTGQLALFTVLYLGENEVERILLWRKLYMKKKLKKILLALIFAVLLPTGNIFAQSRAISANGVTVPSWMQNCIILNSEYTFGRRTIGQVLSIPQEKTKLNKVTVTDTKVSLDYALTKDDGSTIWTLYVEFTCVKSGNGGNCYISMLKFEEPLSFKKETVTCSSPYEYNHGVCLGMLYECSQYMFIDEVRFNEQKAYEENIKKVEENLLNDFVSRTSSTYIDDELLDLGKIKADSFEKDYMFRLYAVANRASVKKGLTPCYYQKIGDAAPVYDTSKWKFLDRIYQKNEIYLDESATGFIIRGNWKDDLTLARKDFEHKAQIEAKRKVQRDKEDEEFIAKVLAMKPSSWYTNGKIQYSSEERFSFDFSWGGYSSYTKSDYITDYARIYAILNKASEKAGFSPCYYQMQGGKKIFNPEKWQLGNWNQDVKYGTWEKTDTIEQDSSCNGFYYNGEDGQVYRKDSEAVEQKIAEIKAQKAKLKAQRDKEDEEIIAKILKMEIRNYSTPDSLYYDSGSVMYNDYYGRGLWFNAEGYGSEGRKLKDVARLYAIMNKASEKAGFSPCYYQEQNGEQIFDSEKWQLGEWKGASVGWEKGGTIKQQKDKNGFYCTETSIYRNDPVVVAELLEKKRAEEEALNAKLKAQRDEEDIELIEEILSREPSNWSDSGEIRYGQEFRFNSKGYTKSNGAKIEDAVRMYSILNKASVKLGFSPCYYQIQDGNKIYDSDKWDLGEWKAGESWNTSDWNRYSWEKADTIKCDESANGFRREKSYDGYHNGLVYRIDSKAVEEHKAKLKAEEEAKKAEELAKKAKYKADREKKDAEDAIKIAEMKFEYWSNSGKIKYGRYHFNFSSSEYYSISSIDPRYDDTRISAIMNKASEEAGFRPCYYQEQDGEKVFDSNKWQLGKWEYYYGWAQKKTIKKDNDSNGFYYESQGYIYGDIYRYDPEYVAQKRAEEEAQKAKELAEKEAQKAREQAAKAEREAKLKAIRDNEDEEIIAKILEMKIRNYSMPDSLYYDSGSIMYNDYYGQGLWFNAAGYGSDGPKLKDATRLYAIMNKASEKAGFSPCYYQEQDGAKIFDSDKWQLGEWKGASIGWEKGRTIKQQKDKNGFYCTEISIYRNDPVVVAELEEKKRAEEEAKKAEELAKKAKYKADREKKDAEDAIKIAEMKFEYWSNSGKIKYGRYHFNFSSSEYYSISSIDPRYDDTRISAIMNKASEEAGFRPCYYQEQDGEKVFDSNKWQLGKWEYYYGWAQKKTIKKDNDSNGFYYESQGAIYGDIYRNDPEAVAKLEEKKRAEEEAKRAKELAEKAEKEAMLKARRDTEDEKYIANILAMEPEKYYKSGEVQYGTFNNRFDATNYSCRLSSVTADTVRIYAILNKASEKAGFKPCYYQEQDGERIFDSSKWQLGEWDYDIWEKTKTIKQENTSNGFYYYNSYVLRNDFELVMQKVRQNEEIQIAIKLCSMSSQSRHGRFEYESLPENFPLDSEICVFAIMNRASTFAKLSPCYYQMQNGTQVFDTDKWIFEYDKDTGTYTNGSSIQETKKGNGFRFDKKKRMIIRNKK